jgi:rfaE bifunctional protein nucleotidyltransferase chain/domain
MKYRFGIIGLGRVGSAMLALLNHAGHIPVWSVSSHCLENDIPCFSSLPDTPDGVDVVFIAVPDGVIKDIAETIAKQWAHACSGIVFFHFSGLFSSDLLSGLTKYGGEVASLHPLQSIMDVAQAQQAIKKSFFTVEGSENAIEIARYLVLSIGSKLIPIAKRDKILYHTAAVIASNYLVSLVSQATQLMEEVGLSREHLIPLIKGTVSNFEAHGQSALTGPVQRGDWQTVKAHLNEIYERFPDILPSYEALGLYTARLAKKKWPGKIDICEKLRDSDSMAKKIQTLKARDMRIVFTNGCFDIIHEGHVSYLRQAKNIGDVLIVGLNSDASVTRLKGPDRPINGQFSRAAVLAGLESVDYVCIFDEDTPYELIKKLLPQILVKGGDWEKEDIVGSDIVMSHGGEVHALSFKEGHSTTAIIQRIKDE